MSSNNQYDAIVIGAGMGGIHSLHVLRQLGLSVKVLESAEEIGGTWWYNRYPGCMSDTESFVYRFFWDTEDLQTYPWPNRYDQGPEILSYLRHVVAKHDMRKHIQLNSTVVECSWDDAAAVWVVTTERGERFNGRYLITAPGTLHKAVYPDIHGLDSFKGVLAHSARWDPDLDVSGKRVGVIGCGATGVQIITAIAPNVGSLVSFQGTPQYSVPAVNCPITPQQRARINVHYEQIIEQVWKSASGFGFMENTRPTMSVSPEERERIFEDLWAVGQGTHFLLGGFGDLLHSPEANEEACRFIRRKIRQIVKDPEMAEKVTPKEPFARRPLCDSGYYETLNRDNVQVVSCQENPIAALTQKGIEMRDGTGYDLDIIIFATGFEAFTGAYSCFPIRGRGGKLLMDHWQEGGRSYLGISCAGFPNMFMINGPLTPFGNQAATMQAVTRPISRLIEAAERMGRHEDGKKTSSSCIVEAEAEAEENWFQRCQDMAEGSLFKLTNSYFFERNAKGEATAVRLFLGGLKMWGEIVDDVFKDANRGFTIRSGC